ncbi:DUF5777 family beta-barrel protein [Portibacter lacus]|uniref:DUF5777 domain-containing protein n=1 Tax=Portibacter lacus TaxID=1099794 RepID=A0AA37SNP6_9BACT|nr:DUF5777 family beta-barrel protein [Portibacter lacus]GLR16849.1 hypothetical protein GCM10007940_14640 [Portibacter lacus]
MLKDLLLVLTLISVGTNLIGQDLIYETFKDRRVINNHSVETLPKRKLDVRIGHRFGNLLGETGGWQTFYGLENSTDILTGLEYGVTDAVDIGFFRTKGSSELRQNLNGFLKAKLMAQNTINNPITVTVLGMSSYSTMAKSETEGVISSFPLPAHRLSFHAQLMLARKFSPGFSLQIHGAWTYRNLVYEEDQNDLVSAGLSARIQITRVMGLILDGTYPFSNLRVAENGYYPALGIGFEFETGGGHVFQINLTNATGMSETDFIPYTTSNWADGEFRLGFTISRIFNL